MRLDKSKFRKKSNKKKVKKNFMKFLTSHISIDDMN